MIIAVDPGKHAIGWAVFANARPSAFPNPSDWGLVDCGYTAMGKLTDVSHARDCDEVVIEIPQVYMQRQWKGNPNDLIDVAFMAGMSACIFGRCTKTITTIRPHTWKGSRPKKVCNRVTRDTLTEHEHSIVNAVELSASKRHNMMDAIGIGLWKVGRR